MNNLIKNSLAFFQNSFYVLMGIYLGYFLVTFNEQSPFMKGMFFVVIGFTLFYLAFPFEKNEELEEIN